MIDDRYQYLIARFLLKLFLGLTFMAPETGFLREFVGTGEVFS
ncbi:hypothetical protein [Phormidium nigroviride]